MPSGSCVCGYIKYSFEGDPAAAVACHCLPCRKTSGTSNSLNLLVQQDKFKTESGTYKQFTRKGDSGKDVIYNYCPHCPTILFVEAKAFAGLYIVKMGGIDEETDRQFLDKTKMQQELYTRNRFEWCAPIAGAEQKEVS